MQLNPSPLRVFSRCETALAASNRSRLGQDLVAIFLLTLFAGWLTTGHFLATHTLYHDNHKFYGLFRDQLHAANRFGEWALWFPHYQGGWPGYYYNFLGDLNCSSPVFVLHQAVFWLAGRFGFFCDDFFYPFIAYFGFEVPLLAQFATYFLARQLFRDARVVRYVSVVSAFSPGVMLNVSDVGFLEAMSYGLFFVATFIAWYRRPSYPRWLLLAFAASVVATSVNFTFLIWNVTFLSVGLLVYVASQPRAMGRLKALLMTRFLHIALLIASAVLCAAPNIIVLLQGGDMVRSHIGDTRYSIDDMAVGSPVEALSASIPGVGMAWKDKVFKLVKPDQVAAAYTYLGFACWPFLIVLLARARPRLKFMALTMMMFFFGMVLLGPASPFWSACLSFVPVLRANNHFSDLLYRGGGYIVLLFAAAAGFGLFLRGDGVEHRRLVLIGIGGVAACSLVTYALLAGENFLAYPALGFMVLTAVTFSAAILQPSSVGHRQPWPGFVAAGLLALVLVDVATNAYSHVRAVFIGNGTTVRDEVLSTNVGFVSKQEEYANHLVCDRRFLMMAKSGFDPRQLPATIVFARAHAETTTKDEMAAFVAAVKDSRVPSLCIDALSAGKEPFVRFVDVDALPVTDIRMERRSMTYNTVSYVTESQKEMLCYFNDAYSPYWIATLDGRPTPIARALVRGKVVVVPPGRHDLAFAFRPPLVLWSLACSYGVLAILAGLALKSLVIGQRLRKSSDNS